jgi:tetratricopeptide (TPR) repeat protein
LYLSTNGYQKIHTEQLAKLYKITGGYSDKFARQITAVRNISALNNNGSFLAKLGKYKESIVFFDKALAINPNYVYALNNKNSALEELIKISLQ